MCLDLVKSSKERIAETDIICYKHVKYRKLSDGSVKYLTPYRGAEIEIGSTYESPIVVCCYYGTPSDIEIALHSFRSKTSCLEDINEERHGNDSNLLDDSYVLVKCCIPQGSRYYVGRFSGKICYASNKITYLEKIKSFKIIR